MRLARKLALKPVTKLGLLFIPPDAITRHGLERLSYDASLKWAEVQKDEDSFLEFMDSVLSVLELPEAPSNTPGCPWCDYSCRLAELE